MHKEKSYNGLWHPRIKPKRISTKIQPVISRQGNPSKLLSSINTAIMNEAQNLTDCQLDVDMVLPVSEQVLIPQPKIEQLLQDSQNYGNAHLYQKPTIPHKEGKVSVLKKSGRLRINKRDSKSRSCSPEKVDIQANGNIYVLNDALSQRMEEDYAPELQSSTAKTILEHPEMTLRRSHYEPSGASKLNLNHPMRQSEAGQSGLEMHLNSPTSMSENKFS